MQENSNLDVLRKIILPAYLHKRWVVVIFVVVNLIAVIAGYNWPKQYISSTTVFVEEENILGPLMQGTAVQTEVVDRARIAREILFGRKIMQEILVIGGWMKSNPSPVDQEQLMDQIQKRTTISIVGRNLVEIAYKDTDPERAFIITKGFADLFIEGSLHAKVQESESAFNFIDKQAKEYERKLKESEEALKEFRERNVDFRDGAEENVTQRINQYRNEITQLEEQTREAEIRKASLQAQLSGETETAAGLTRAEQVRSRIAELQSQLNTLRLSYHDTYPDIVQIENQISELRETLQQEEEKRRKAKREGKLYIDESIRANPIYQSLQSDLYQTNTLLATLSYRLDKTKKSLADEMERDKRIAAAEATLKDLTRDYTVNNNVYQDLLRRRENARVSMNLDKDHQGLTLRINEPAYYPHSPSGPRFIHFILGGILLGILLPIGIFYLLQQISPRVFDMADINQYSDIPVIGELSHYVSLNEQAVIKKEVILLSSLVFSVFVVIAIVSYIRIVGG